jgi:murein DD-endopeptidase MepM/ murein hydrolase activator NlpD
MLNLSVNLPPKYRLQLTLVKRRKYLDDRPLLPNLGEVLRVKKGSRLSRYFRYLFEHKNIRRVLGTNLALFVFASSLIAPANTNGLFDVNKDGMIDNSITEAPIVLTTNLSPRNPVQEMKITQKFAFYHPGVDLDGITGDPIKPILKGVVTAANHSRIGYGNAIYIKHEEGLASLYAHLSKIEVTEGQEVDTTVEIGKMGSTGHSSGDHLHLEVYKDGKVINPLLILPKP